MPRKAWLRAPSRLSSRPASAASVSPLPPSSAFPPRPTSAAEASSSPSLFEFQSIDALPPLAAIRRVDADPTPLHAELLVGLQCEVEVVASLVAGDRGRSTNSVHRLLFTL